MKCWKRNEREKQTGGLSCESLQTRLYFNVKVIISDIFPFDRPSPQRVQITVNTGLSPPTLAHTHTPGLVVVIQNLNFLCRQCLIMISINSVTLDRLPALVIVFVH